MGIRVTLGGIPLSVDKGMAFSWSLAYGVGPVIRNLEVTASVADEIAKLGRAQFNEVANQTGPLTLLFEDTDNGRKVEINGIYVIAANRPGRDYNTRVLTLADRRWLFDRVVVERSYNIRRKSGDFRIVRGALTDTQSDKRQGPDVDVQLGALRADFVYRRATLYGGDPSRPIGEGSARPWKALEVLKDVLEEICGEDGYVIDEELTLVDSIEGLELHEPGASALARVLGFVPGAQVYAGTDGKIHVASIYDGSEEQVFKDLGSRSEYSGYWSKVDRSMQRPGVFHVYSDREAELRFDFIEEKAPTDKVAQSSIDPQSPQGVKGKEPLYVENVIINPLYYLPLDSNGDRIATQGEPVPVDQFIDAVNILNDQSAAGGDQFGTKGFRPFFPNFRLTAREIRRHWLGNWPAFREQFCRDEAGLFNVERLLLLSALRTHWRQTFRLLPQWRDKIRSISATRAAVLDYETGTRAPAPVFTQFLTKFSQLGYNPDNRGTMATRNDTYAEDISEKNVAPFVVNVLDSDMGLFRIGPRPDQTGVAETYVIGDTEGGELPSADTALAAVFWHQVRLDRGFKLATILTCLQDVPNSEKRLHREVVSLEDAAKLLKLGVTGDYEAKGPPYELLQTSDTARYGWLDDKKDAIRAAFLEGEDFPEGLMVNPKEIRALSVAAAAEVLQVYVDKVEGQVTTGLLDVEPTGNLQTVTHAVTVGGQNNTALLTTLHAPGVVPAPGIYSLLPEGVRRKVRRMVQ